MTCNTPSALFALSEIEMFGLASIALHCAREGDGDVLRILVERHLRLSTTLSAEQREEALAWLHGESAVAATPGGGD
jgi:hypothetical protein